MQGLLMIGPREWGNDHYERLKKHPFTAMQYSARNLNDARSRLPLLAKPFPLFVYTPKNYQGRPNGSQTVEFACRVLDYRISNIPITSPWPTINGAQWYDKYQDFKYELWFKVDLIQKCNLPIPDFVFHKKNGTDSNYDTIKEFISPARGNILFASSKFKFIDTEVSNVKIDGNLLIPTSNDVELDLRVNKLLKYQLIEKPKGNQNPQKSETTNTVYIRDPHVKAWVLQEAKGVCELCHSKAPFVDSLGNLYLEVHHILSLANNGADTISNAVALCPNCHRKSHYSDGVEKIKYLLTRIILPKRTKG